MQGGKNMISERGGGGKKIIFNVKYRPLSVGIILFGFGSSIIKQIRYGSLSRPRQKTIRPDLVQPEDQDERKLKYLQPEPQQTEKGSALQ